MASERMAALLESLDRDEVAHYGVKGMKWGVITKGLDAKYSGGSIDRFGNESDEEYMARIQKMINDGVMTPESIYHLGSGKSENTYKDLMRILSKSTDENLKLYNLVSGYSNRLNNKLKGLSAKDRNKALEKEKADVFERIDRKKRIKELETKIENKTWDTALSEMHEDIGEHVKELMRKPMPLKHSYKEESPMMHSAIQELLASEVDDDSLAHHGVKGMKWGIRKQRSSGKRSSRKARKTEERRSNVKKSMAKTRPKNTFTDQPQNGKLTDAQMKKIIDRIRLEQEFVKLTTPPPLPPKVESRLKKAMVDTAYAVGTGAVTEVGKMILSQALKVEYNKRASKPYQLNIKGVKDAIEDAVNK